jgi:hypothetical protein
MKEQYLNEIELPIWQDPQGDLIIEKGREFCCIYFACWKDNEAAEYADYIGKITFENAWAVKSLDVEFYDIRPKVDWQFKSSICIVENSEWLDEVIGIRSKYYDNWTRWKDREYKHYLVRGHDNYFEVIAENFFVEKVSKKNFDRYTELLID